MKTEKAAVIPPQQQPSVLQIRLFTAPAFLSGLKRHLSEKDSKHFRAHVWRENLDPARFLLSSDVFEAERHSLLVCVPALHLLPVKGNNLVLNGTQRVISYSHNRNNRNTEMTPQNQNEKAQTIVFQGLQWVVGFFPQSQK